jgi:HAMP domain-containing protein
MRLTWPCLGAVAKSLSARLLVLTLFFVVVSEVLIYVPSIVHFRLAYSEEHIDSAHLTTFALEATPEGVISPELERDLLRQPEIDAAVAKGPEIRELILGGAIPPTVHAFFHLRRAMFEFSGRILSLSLVIGLIIGGLVFLRLNLLIIRPMRRITDSMTAFREAPQRTHSIVPTSRRDEIGLAQRELAEMQSELRMALKQKERPAELGDAVSKIKYDLRNILATAQLVSDRLSDSGGPEVRRVTPTLNSAIDRAVELCSQTLQFGSAKEPMPQRSLYRLYA